MDRMRRAAVFLALAASSIAPARADQADGGAGFELRPLSRPEQLRADLASAGELVMLGDFDEATRLVEATRAELAASGDTEGACEALGMLGGIRGNADDYDAAVELFQRAVACARTDELRRRLETSLASVRIDAGDLEGARRGYEQALAALPAGESQRRIEALGQLGWIAHTLGDVDRAEALFARAGEVLDKWKSANHPQWRVEYWLRRRRVWLDAARGRIELAVESMQLATDYADQILREQIGEMTEREMLMAKHIVEYELNSTIALNVGPAVKSGAAARLALTNILRAKGLALEALAGRQRMIRASWSPSIERDLVELSGKRAEIARLALSGEASQGRARAQALLALERDAERLEQTAYGKAVRAEYRTSTGPEDVKLADVQAAVPDGAALLELERYRPYVVNGRGERDRWGAPRYVAYVLRSKGDPRVVDLGDAATLDRRVLLLRAALATPQGDAKRLGRVVDEQLMRPVRALLGDAERLYVAPAGLLDLLPFDALVDEDGRWLVERYAVSYVASGRDLRPSPSRPSRGPAVVVGGASFDATAGRVAHARRSIDLREVRFSPLPGTLAEVKSVGGLLDGARVLTGRAATKRALEELHGPRVLHVATHAFFLSNQAPPLLDKTRQLGAENPLLRSGLALAGANVEHTGGIATALEVAGLDSDGTRLVVLSACETGVGGVLTDEGVAGLLRALVVAGAETEVVSLWKVDDEATRRLMIDYYQRLKRGAGRGDAMREVRRAMLAQPATRHPYYWASFAVWGRTAPLDEAKR